MGEFFEELAEEAEDFFGDYLELVFKKKRIRPLRQKEALVGGVVFVVRPAYLFAERIDNLLKIVFGVSICLSAITATFLGFTKLSDLLDVLIGTLWGRGIMFVIGSSYFVVSFWKILHLKDREKDAVKKYTN